MPPVKDPVANAVFEFVSTGSYPADTSLIDASLKSSTLDSLGKLLSQARSDVRTSIRELSALSAPDIDGWIAQAKQLRADRDASIAKSEEIQQLDREREDLRDKEQDAGAQVKLLEGEVRFTAGLREALELVKSAKDTAARGKACLADGDLIGAVKATQEAQEYIQGGNLGALRGTTAVDLLVQRVEEEREKVLVEVNGAWNRLVFANEAEAKLTIKGKEGKLTLPKVAEALDDMGLLQPKVARLDNWLNELIVQPRLDPQKGSNMTITVNGGSVSCGPAPSRDDGSVKRLFSELQELRSFLKVSLPASAETLLGQSLWPHIQKSILRDTLPRAVPPDLDGISYFRDTLKDVSSFVAELNASGWQDTGRLAAWVESAPQVWLHTRSASSLDSLRQMLKRGLGNPRSVERVETQTIVESEDILAANGSADDWNAEWDEDEEEDGAKEPAAAGSHKATAPAAPDEDDEDTSNWDWDEEGGNEKPAEEQEKTKDEEDDDADDAWGWDAEGDEKDEEAEKAQPDQSQGTPAKQPPKKQSQQANGLERKTAPVERIMTLRESYHITALPEQILELLVMAVEDADSLSGSSDSSNPIVQAAPSLYALPGTLLAMYRAGAPMAYGMNDSGNMYLYNDSQYLAEQLRSFSQHHASRFSGPDTLVLQPDIAALEIFGKRSYSREMEAQRTILGDLLDGAQGFSNCTEEPHAGQCDLAITSVIDRIRQVHGQWQGVLSPSALLQATGSLLSTVVSKIIVDIEDLSDIGEAESQRLTGYCMSISSLEDIFMPEKPEGVAEDEEDNRVPSTAVYAPSWLKFQYLSNILESNLVDIKYLWTEGGLSLEYSADEVVDLIEALFADSPRRKEAINEIKRG